MTSGAVVDAEASLPLAIQTPNEAWAYAALFPATDYIVSAPVVVVRVAVTVSHGRVGIGCLNAPGTEFLEEILVPSASGSTTVELLVANPHQRGALVVRNASMEGASEATVHEIRCFALETEPDTHREPALSAPRPIASWSRYYGTAGETAAEKLRVRRFDLLEEPVILRWSDGLSIRILPKDQLSRALYVSGTYEPNTLVVLRALLKPGDVFMDIGANAGVISLVASRFVGPGGRVYSFEPSEREFGRLLDTVGRNDARNITPIRIAVTSGEGTATLRIAAASFGGLNTLGEYFPYDGVETLRLERVQTCTLDGFITRAPVEHVALIKLDIEGAEVAALRGARQLLMQRRPALVLEVFSRSLEANGCTCSDLEQILNAAAYRLFSIDDAARLHPLAGLADSQEQNIVALPEEHALNLRSGR